MIRCFGLTFPQSEALSSAFPGPCSSCLSLTSSAPRDKQTLAKPQTEVPKSYPHPPLQTISELPLSWGEGVEWRADYIPFPQSSLHSCRKGQGTARLRVLMTELEEGAILGGGTVAKGATSP